MQVSAQPTQTGVDSAEVLLVEDDDDIREAIAMLLEEEGYRVATASNGRQALDALHPDHLPKVVLLDLMMPIMSGWQFLDVVRANPRLANLNVVVISAVAESGELGNVRRIVRKPIDLDELLDVVNNCSKDGSAGPQHPT